MRSTRQKQCDRCSDSPSVLYRVQMDESGQWFFVCDRCLPTLKDNNSAYRYGGTWKAKKR
ncbi:hypothetical protein IQ268_12710 [Oculatella sp. LEGE 06141]|uniref:hypothetical protein n=1 Tax=Oculatella sp. LEGE 06141 TaxID=1828648 RepID=UPI001881486A|nr:hypothetical protein [Oculatella sp. LEGE 06141]MBE9179424.1 hypothetical protein [Oculatella sp. LEGE 06141]